MSALSQLAVSWHVFEQRAESYEAWYHTPRGQLVSDCERAMLRQLLRDFPTARSLLDIGCGSGHFTAWLAEEGWSTIGLDRAPAMLEALRKAHPGVPLVLADAHRLPVAHGAVDLCLFVTTLEFLEDPGLALREAAAVARQGIVVLALNRWSAGGLSRRFGTKARRPILGQARDFSLPEPRALLHHTLASRLQHVWWSSTLFPPPCRRLRVPIALGDILGVAAQLKT